MAEKRSVAVMVIIETDDKRLLPESLDMSSAAAVAAVRRAVVANLPKLTRVVAVMSDEEARLMFAAHELAIRSLGGEFHRPPAGYVAPADRRDGDGEP